MKQTSLSRFAPAMRDPDPRAALQAARDAYRESGGKIILINLDWLQSWPDRKMASQIGAKALNVKEIEQ